MNSSKNVIITQCHVRFGYNVLGSLRQAGYSVIAGSEESVRGMSYGTKPEVSHFSYPNPFSYSKEFVATINEVAGKYKEVFFLPVHEDIFIAAKYREHFCKNIKLLVPPIATLMNLHDKHQLHRQCLANGILTPDTWEIDDFDQLKRLAKEMIDNDGLVLKPRFGEGARGVIFAKSIRDLIRREKSIRKALSTCEYIMQRKVFGRGVGVGVLRLNQRTIALSGHVRLREVPSSGGASCARRTFFHEGIYADSEKLLDAINFSGVCLVEFRYDSNTEKYYVLDVNPRYWGGLSAHIESGVDFPKLHLDSASQALTPAAVVTPSEEIESRWALGEARALIEGLMQGRLAETKKIFSRPKHLRVVYEDTGSLKSFSFQCVSYLKRISRRGRAANVDRFAFFSQLVKSSDGSKTGSSVSFLSANSQPTSFQTELDRFVSCLSTSRDKLLDDEVLSRILRESDLPFIPCEDVAIKQLFDHSSRVLFEVGKLSLPLGIGLCMHFYVLAALATFPLNRLSPAHMARKGLIRKIYKGKILIANTGSARTFMDNRRLEGRLAVKKNGAGYVLNGSGSFMSLAGIADMVLLTAVSPQDVSYVMAVPLGDERIKFIPFYRDPVFAESRTCSIEFRNVVVPRSLVFKSDSRQDAGMFQRIWFQGLVSSVYLGCASAVYEQLMARAKHKFFARRGKYVNSMDDFRQVASRFAVNFRTAELLTSNIGNSLADLVKGQANYLVVCEQSALAKFYVSENLLVLLRKMLNFYGMEGLTDEGIQSKIHQLAFAGVQPMSALDVLEYYSKLIIGDD